MEPNLPRGQAANVQLRDAIAGDSSDLALLTDAATRRLVAWLWDQGTEPGQSTFEIGRTMMRSNVDSVYHFSNWRVAEVDGQVVGGLNSFVATAPVPMPGASQVVLDVLAPLNELKKIAVDSWYVSTASVFPEVRGQGVGHVILTEADRLAVAAGCDRVTLMVASFNVGALRLYERLGYSELGRRTFIEFDGSDQHGDWMLMGKDLTP